MNTYQPDEGAGGKGLAGGRAYRERLSGRSGLSQNVALYFWMPYVDCHVLTFQDRFSDMWAWHDFSSFHEKNMICLKSATEFGTIPDQF